ncbi:HEAT repeat domain-containing protein [Fulvivirga maritima]|uniref:HEAT repeat domain-containing protein n=1 Tax=Fulvivirga maritima TaxID=2904247 RepID=UPI001F384A13|nr:HEAT repeat domain-containing protein [Fulvivirga maritima]UII29174.1 HEAT repeat domain-containing protein [Fulvivirga maritima]
MEEKYKELIIRYIEGDLDAAEQEEVALRVNQDGEWKIYYEEMNSVYSLLQADREFEPDTSLKGLFEKAIAEEEGNERQSEPIRQVYFPLWKVAAAVALVISGVFIGAWWMKNKGDEQMMALENEIRATRQLVLQSLNNQNSSSMRLQGINVAYKIEKTDDVIIDALIRTLNNDDNSNVRIAAMAALARFSEQPKVMQALLASMETQTDPVVQINLINLMVTLKQKKAVDKFQEIIKSDSTQQAVKDEAYMALFKMI